MDASERVQTLLLEVVAGNATGTEIEVIDDFLFGRHAPGAGTLAEDVELSRHHARVSCTPTGAYLLEDLASTNGTFVNGTRLTTPHELCQGDRISLGTTVLVATRVPSTAADTAAAAADAADADADADATSQPPPLALRVEVDFEQQAVRIALDDDSDAVTFIHHDGRWGLP